MDRTIRKRVEELHNKDRHEEIVWLLERLETPDAESCSLLARAYNNLGRYEEAESLLLSAPQPENPLLSPALLPNRKDRFAPSKVVFRRIPTG